AEDQSAGRARLSDALRGGVVDGDSLGWVFIVEVAGACGAAEQREVCGVSNAAGSEQDARTADGPFGLAVCGRIADGRGDASAGDSCQRPVWPTDAGAGWGAGA